MTTHKRGKESGGARPVAPPGLEMVILKKLPSVTAASVIVPCLFYLAFLYSGAADAKAVMSAGIVAVAICLTLLTFIFTLAIGCWIVVLMKGPPQKADSYPLVDAERPRVADKDEDGFEA